MTGRRRVALYGGTFDPPHVCHVLAATWLACDPTVDELRVVPVYRHAFGKRATPFELRCEMLEVALGHLGPGVRVDRIEQQLGGTSYTIDTVRALGEREPDVRLALVCGTDIFRERQRWRAWDELRRLVEFIVLGRDGEPDPPGEEVCIRLPPVSSSEVRQLVRAGRPYRQLVPRPVWRLIERHGLYQT